MASLFAELEEKPVAKVVVSAEDVRAVFDHWRTYHPQAAKNPHSGMKEWQKIVGRLREGYSVAQLCRAIDGIHKSPFHRGENDRGTKYLNLLVCFRESGQVDKFVELAAEEDAPVLSENTQRAARAAESWLKRHDDTPKLEGPADDAG